MPRFLAAHAARWFPGLVIRPGTPFGEQYRGLVAAGIQHRTPSRSARVRPAPVAGVPALINAESMSSPGSAVALAAPGRTGRPESPCRDLESRPVLRPPGSDVGLTCVSPSRVPGRHAKPSQITGWHRKLETASQQSTSATGPMSATGRRLSSSDRVRNCSRRPVAVNSLVQSGAAGRSCRAGRCCAMCSNNVSPPPQPNPDCGDALEQSRRSGVSPLL